MPYILQVPDITFVLHLVLRNGVWGGCDRFVSSPCYSSRQSPRPTRGFLSPELAKPDEPACYGPRLCHRHLLPGFWFTFPLFFHDMFVLALTSRRHPVMLILCRLTWKDRMQHYTVLDDHHTALHETSFCW